MNETEKKGFIHYEISNFAKAGKIAIHNTNYWRGEKYIGIGPSAHSFDGNTRQWNINNNNTYIHSVSKNEIPFTKEILSKNEKYNEYILTGLRTMWGVDVSKIKLLFGEEYKNYFLSEIKPYLTNEILQKTEFTYILSQSGKHLADKISSDLFYMI